MRKPKSPLRTKLAEMDALYNYWLPRTPVSRLTNIGKVSPCRFKVRYAKAIRFFGTCCDRYGVSQASAYLGISREDGIWMYRYYRNNFSINERLNLLKTVCGETAKVYNR